MKKDLERMLEKTGTDLSIVRVLHRNVESKDEQLTREMNALLDSYGKDKYEGQKVEVSRSRQSGKKQVDPQVAAKYVPPAELKTMTTINRQAFEAYLRDHPEMGLDESDYLVDAPSYVVLKPRLKKTMGYIPSAIKTWYSSLLRIAQKPKG